MHDEGLEALEALLPSRDDPSGGWLPKRKFDEWGEPYLDVPCNPASASLRALSAGTHCLKPGVSLRTIPHRKWLYGVELLRGETTVLASPGGVGKSSLALAIAVSVATGRRLLDAKVYGTGLKALYINAEDGRVEMQRRLWGLCLEYAITEQDLTQLSLLGADDGHVHRMSFLRAEKNTCVLDQSGIDALEGLLNQLKS